jgi:hypothetical protein
MPTASFLPPTREISRLSTPHTRPDGNSHGIRLMSRPYIVESHYVARRAKPRELREHANWKLASDKALPMIASPLPQASNSQHSVAFHQLRGLMSSNAKAH